MNIEQEENPRSHKDKYKEGFRWRWR